MERRHGAVDHHAAGRPSCAHARAMTTTGPANVVMNELCAPPAIAFVAYHAGALPAIRGPQGSPQMFPGPNPDGLVADCTLMALTGLEAAFACDGSTARPPSRWRWH
jgi:hypothetical protein